MEEIRWEGQNFSEVVAPQEEEKEEEVKNIVFVSDRIPYIVL